MKITQFRFISRLQWRNNPALNLRKLIPTDEPKTVQVQRDSFLQKALLMLRIAMSSSTQQISNTLAPPEFVRGMKSLDKEKFKKTVQVPTLQILNTQVDALTNCNDLKKLLIKMRGIKQFGELSSNDPRRHDMKVAILNPEICPSPETLDDGQKEQLISLGVDLSTWQSMQLDLSYKNWGHETILDAILPYTDRNLTVTSFSLIGHIVHLNLKDELLEYKDIIGQVLLDKVPPARTVINKTNTIDNTFRNFQLQVIAGEEDFITVTREYGLKFKMDFSKVYWNPRLSTEHHRLLKLFKPEDIVFDVFAGVGPFAIPAAKKPKCTVYANDLNPESFKWLNENIKLNKVREDLLTTYNLDGREFMKKIVREEMLKLLENDESMKGKIHIVMNLPLLAVEFTDVFPGLLSSDDTAEMETKKYISNFFPVVNVYCYCFHTGEDADQHIKTRLETHMAVPAPKDLALRLVRNVAPGKNMYCATFTLTKDVLYGEHSDTCEDSTSELGEPSTKKMKC